MEHNYNKVNLSFFGQNFVLTTDEDPQYLQSLAEGIRGKISALEAGLPNMPELMKMILVCLEYADAAKKAQAEIQTLQEQSQQYLQQASGAREDAELYREKADALQKECSALDPSAIEALHQEYAQKIEAVEKRVKAEESNNCKLLIEKNHAENECLVAQREAARLRRENHDLAKQILALTEGDDAVFSKEENERLKELVLQLEREIQAEIIDQNQLTF